jgi:hypothetical protein
MKAKIYISIILMTIFYTAKAQTFCHTPNHSSNQSLNTMMRSSSLANNSYCVKIYMHVIRRTNGTGGQTTSAVNQAFQILNEDFNPHDISFNWDSAINYIDNDSYYNSPGVNIYNVNNHTDGIDIYLYDDDAPAGGRANGVGESSEFYLSGSFWNSPYSPLVTSHVISHEMGHILFLWHTHHGTGEGGNCAELVDGTNSDVCGDYVTDTPADPHLQFNVSYPNCQWTGSGTDANGDSYTPDEQNIMAYTHVDCMDYFTPFQGSRARNAIATLPFLQQTVVSCCIGDDLDLYVKDSPDDDGTEPNTVTEHMWTSNDIWIRNNDDHGFTHQNPEYKSNGEPNYIYVRVINKGCFTSSGDETLTINWAKANTALAWPQNWDGSLTNSGGYSLGGVLPDVIIGTIDEGGFRIVTIPWVVPNPDNYTIGEGSDNPWHFCLLSKINATNDPLSFPMTSNPNIMVRNNNNLAWKNLTVVDLESEFTSGRVMIANPHNVPKTYFLELQMETNESGKAIFDEAEVTLKMDDVIFNAWERGGKQAELLEDKSDEKRKLVKGDNVILDNIMFEPNERGLLTLDFNFLTKELTDKIEYKYHVIQKDAITGEVIGGETFLIKKKSRPIFIADAGNDKEIDENETITISAEQINEAAIYNWYDMEGNLIYQGEDLTVSADVTKKYKLEIIAETDGFKDYDEIEIKLKPSIIENISPNPTSNEIQVNYKLNGVHSAYLMIIGQYGTNGTSNNYVLDTNSSQTTINVINYTNGFYTVALVCNGQIVDAKTLIKQ